MTSRRGCVCAVLAVAFVLLSTAPAAWSRDVIVRSFDGTPIVTHFFPAGGPHAGEPAPTVIVGSGFPYPGATSPADGQSDTVGSATLLGAGFNVVTWDARGIGASGGTVRFSSPAYEARDVQAIVDYVAAQPEALLDAAGDPRVGMSGPSYSGAVQLLTAALDPRVDAIVPDVTWNSLLTSLFRDGAVKTGFYVVCADGEVNGTLGGAIFGAAGIQLGGLDASVTRACVESLAASRLSPASTQWAADRGPGELLEHIRAPTLIEQGTVDTLFPPGQAAANYDVLRRNGVPVKMLWYCGGHGTCPDDAAASRARRSAAALTWLRRWLQRDATIDTGPRFEWVDDRATWHSGPDFPLAPKGTVDASGSGSLIVSALDSLGSTDVVSAVPASNAVNVAFPTPAAGSDLVGEPTVKLTYHGTAVPAQTYLYGQVLDVESGRVVGHQVAPIPVTLDGRTRTVERSLEMIAVRSETGSGYRLQITPGTPVYAPQRSTGRVVLDSVAASLPIVDATRSGRPGAARAVPPRLRLRVSSRRSGRRVARIVLSSRLLAKPCSGSVLFSVRAGGKVARRRAPVRASCVARKVIRMRVRRGTRARLGARFDGNDALAPRRARSRTVRLH
jgi:ABC-2 type transport system ATP-binding protein